MDKLGLFDFLPAEMEYWGVPGMSWGVMKDGEVLALGGTGYRDVEKKLPADENTVYGFASCSKSFASGLTAMLVDEGKLDYDQPIREYIPGFDMVDPVAARDCNLRDFLSHRTGLASHEATWPHPGISKMDVLKAMKYLRPNNKFRTKTQYNNVTFSAIPAIIEYVTGGNYEEMVKERIFKPLGMDRSCMSAHEMYEMDNHAQGYWNYRDGKGAVPVGPWEMDVAAGACGVCSSVKDMLNWVEMHRQNGLFKGERLISERCMNEMHGEQAPMHMWPWDYPEMGQDGHYGMAWFMQRYRGRKFIWHTGEIEGFCTLEGFMPEIGLSIMLAMNIHKPLNIPLLMTCCYNTIDRLTGDAPIDWAARLHTWNGKYEAFYYDWDEDLFKDAPAPVAGTKPSHPLEAYVGQYENPGYGTYGIRLEGDKLILDFKDMPIVLEHRHYDVFKVYRTKQDTKLITCPLSFVTDPYTGDISAFDIQIEPTLSAERFTKK